MTRRRPRVALATAEAWPNLERDDQSIAPALARHQIDAAIAIWSNASVAWESFDAVVIRSCWDYHDRLDQWLDWVDRIGSRPRPQLINPPAPLRWNARKTYLADLEARGLPVVPTRWLDAAVVVSWQKLRAALVAMPWEEMVVKPAVSAGAFATWRVSRTNVDAIEKEARAASRALAARAPLLVQPYLSAFAQPREETVQDQGEWSLLYFGGTLSHAVVKRPAPGDFRVQERHGGSTFAASPPAQLCDVGERVLAAAAAAVPFTSSPASDGLAYARVDLVLERGQPLLIELEVIEPSLFLATAPGAVDRFADAVAKVLLSDPVSAAIVTPPASA